VALGTPTHAGSGTGTTSAVTGSFTPAADSRLIFAVGARKNAGVPAQPTITDSLGSLTWTEIADAQNNFGADPDIRLRVFYSTSVGGSPSSMTVTGSCADGATTTVNGFAITGSDTDFSNFATAANSSSGDPSCTLPNTPAALIAGFMVAAGAAAVTPPTGFSELHELVSGNLRPESCYDDSSPTTGAHTWSSTNGNSAGVVFEIKEAAAGGTGKPTHFMHYQKLRRAA
jgi:hypothetical protein